MKSIHLVNLLFPTFVFVFLTGNSVASVYKNPSNGSEKGQRLINLHYDNSSGEKGVTIFHYDASGLCQTATWKLLDETRYSHNYLTYAPSGKLTLKYREFSDGLISYNRYEYNEDNNLVKETFERSDSVTGQTFYHYDQNGVLTHADCRGLNGWFYGIIKYNYLEDTRVGASILNEGDTIGNIAYQYNHFGNLQSETWEFKSGWSQHFMYEYEPFDSTIQPSFTSSNVFITNTARFKVVKEEYDFNKEMGGPSWYEYDQDGWLMKKIFERSDTFKTVTLYTYNKNGLLTRSDRKYSNGLTAVFYYTFDGNRRLIQRSFERSDGASGSERYLYNEKGWLKKGIYENFDSWLTGTIGFEHDESGLINRGNFESEDGYTAEIRFTHDEYGNITRIHWQFSFGKTQTYTFVYEKSQLKQIQ